MRLGDLDALRKNMEFICMGIMAGTEPYNAPLTEIDNAPTVDACSIIDGLNNEIDDLSENLAWYINERNRLLKERRPQGECKDCDNCEDKALSYSIGLKDGYLLGGFQLTELRRWLTSQGYSEGTVNDKINEFTRFVEKIRGEKE